MIQAPLKVVGPTEGAVKRRPNNNKKYFPELWGFQESSDPCAKDSEYETRNAEKNGCDINENLRNAGCFLKIFFH